MAWLDDRIWCHPKVTDLTDAAFRAHINGIAYSSGFSTGGKLTAGQQKAIGCTDESRAELIAARLWIKTGKDSVRIHDWDDHNGKRDARKAADRERKRRQRHSEMSAGQRADTHADKAEDGPQDGSALNARRRAPDDGSDRVTNEGQDPKAAAGVKSTSSTSVARPAEEPNPEDQENPAAVVAGATEQEILVACQRFGAEPNIAEPWARQLSGDELQAIVVKMEMKIRRGTVEHPPAQFVDLLKRRVAANVKAASAVTIRIPTLEENLHADAVQYARGHHPWDVASDLLTRKMAKLDVPAERRDDLLAVLRHVYDENAEAA